MARMSRLVVPGYPHHITQRGVRSIDIFSSDDDRVCYLKYMSEEAERFGVTFMSWCLMTNHVHLIAVPQQEDSLARAIGEGHRRYTRMKNFSEGVRGYLFQGWFGSCVLDQQHLLAAGRYVERNPVAANMVTQPADYIWSSSRYNNCGLVEVDLLLEERMLPKMVDDWMRFTVTGDTQTEENVIRKTKTGRPAGDETRLRRWIGRELRVKNPGRPRLKIK